MKKIFDFLAKKSDILIRAKPNYQIVYTEKKITSTFPSLDKIYILPATCSKIYTVTR